MRRLSSTCDRMPQCPSFVIPSEAEESARGRKVATWAQPQAVNSTIRKNVPQTGLVCFGEAGFLA